MVPAWKDIFRLSEANRDYYDRDDRLRFRTRANALLLGIVLYAPLGLFDIIAFSEDAHEFLTVRAISSIGIIAAYFWFLRASSRQHREIAIYAYSAFAISGFFTISTINPDTAVYFHFGAVVALFYGGITFFARPALVIMISATTVLIYTLSLFFSAQYPPLILIDTALITITIVTLSEPDPKRVERYQRFVILSGLHTGRSRQCLGMTPLAVSISERRIAMQAT